MSDVTKTIADLRTRLDVVRDLYGTPLPLYHDDYFVCDANDRIVMEPGSEVSHHEGMGLASLAASAITNLPALLDLLERYHGALGRISAIAETWNEQDDIKAAGLARRVLRDVTEIAREATGGDK